MRYALLLVALLSMVWLGARSLRTGLAGGYIDPVGHYDAQDEAIYAQSSTRMAAGATSWGTPMFLGRFAMYKPPLLMWLSAASMKVLGINTQALRFPTLLAAALTACLVWAIARKTGWLAVSLLLTTRLWFVLGSMALTDCLLTACITTAMFCVYRDPALSRKSTMFILPSAIAAAILTKSVAGVLPAVIVALVWLFGPRENRPRISTVMVALAVGLAEVLPWFVYQYATHRNWFLAEHLGVEILSFGAGAPPQTSGENQFAFYFRRLFLTDPFLCIMVLVGLPAFVAGWRRQQDKLVVLVWAGCMLAAALLWRYRNLQYLLPAYPALAIVASKCFPRPKFAWPIFALIVTLKLGFAGTAWGIGFPRLEAHGASALSDYCEQRRGHELIVVDPDDAFYSAVIGLPKVRYLLVTPQYPPRQALDFRYLGVTLTVPEFNNLPAVEPQFRKRLREWDLDSSEPIGTVILARSTEEVAAVMQAHPEADFYITRNGTFIFSRRQGMLNSPQIPCYF